MLTDWFKDTPLKNSRYRKSENNSSVKNIEVVDIKKQEEM